MTRLDITTLLTAIKWYKDQQLTNDYEGDVDEYLDAFVALGGEPDKEGYISKDVLVEIIKEEFELTIDMVVSYTTTFCCKNSNLSTIIAHHFRIMPTTTGVI